MSTPIKPGIYANISNAGYHASEGLSSSNIKDLNKSAAHYKASLADESEETAEMRFGTIVHTLILEPDRVKALIHVGLYNTRRGKDFEQALKDGDGKLVCNEEEFNRASECVEAFREQATSHPYINGEKFKLLDGIKEHSFYWICKDTGLLLKARPDNIHPSGVIVDIKTCRDASPDGFQRAIAEYQYHISAAHYLEGVQRSSINHPTIPSLGMPTQFAFICIESKPPYAVATYFLSADAIELGRQEVRAALEKYTNACTTGQWDAYPKEMVEINLPGWRYAKAINNGVKK